MSGKVPTVRTDGKPSSFLRKEGIYCDFALQQKIYVEEPLEFLPVSIARVEDRVCRLPQL